MRVLIFLFLCLTFFVTQDYSQTPTNENKNKKINLVVEGQGLDKVKVGITTREEIEKEFGKDYKLIAHDDYSYQLKYANLGLSFFYCQSNLQKNIFAIEIRSPFMAKTTKGIILGESTIEDVIRVYGQPKEDVAPWLEYKGIEFRIVNQETEEINTEFSDNKQIINEINVYQYDFQFCK